MPRVGPNLPPNTASIRVLEKCGFQPCPEEGEAHEKLGRLDLAGILLPYLEALHPDAVEARDARRFLQDCGRAAEAIRVVAGHWRCGSAAGLGRGPIPR